MGIGSGIFVFLRPAYHGGKQRMGRPGSREKEIEFEREIPQAKNPPGLSDRGALSQNGKSHGRQKRPARRGPEIRTPTAKPQTTKRPPNARKRMVRENQGGVPPRPGR